MKPTGRDQAMLLEQCRAQCARARQAIERARMLRGKTARAREHARSLQRPALFSPEEGAGWPFWR